MPGITLKIFALVATLLGVTSASVSGGEADLAALVEQVRVETSLPAMGGALIKLGSPVEIAVSGTRRRGDEVPVTATDKWHLGSDTKAMTAVLIGCLVEEGRLCWDSKIAEIFPESTGDFPEAVKGITVEQLLHHRSGLPANLKWGSFNAKKPLVEQRKEVISELAKVKLSFAPGSQELYSNLGYVVLGTIAERLSGKSWEELIRERIFVPLEMTGMGFGGTGTPGQVDQPWPHRSSGKPFQKNGPEMDNPLVMAPAGGVHGPLGSWVRFVEEFLKGLRGEGRLLKQQTYEYLAKPAQGTEMACGWLSVERNWGGRVLTHAGSNTMNYAVAWLAPEKNFAVLVVCNQGGQKAEDASDTLAGRLIQRATK